jgi:hypothetical protein
MGAVVHVVPVPAADSTLLVRSWRAATWSNVAGHVLRLFVKAGAGHPDSVPCDDVARAANPGDLWNGHSSEPDECDVHRLGRPLRPATWYGTLK